MEDRVSLSYRMQRNDEKYKIFAGKREEERPLGGRKEQEHFGAKSQSLCGAHCNKSESNAQRYWVFGLCPSSGF
jgi:hypothetical protein